FLHFPASQAGQCRSLHGQSRAIRTAFQDLGSIEIGMVEMSARSATKTLSGAGVRIDGSALGTSLRAVSWRDFDQRAARPSELVPEHFCETRPRRIRDVARQASLDHSCNVELFDD